MPDPHGAVRLEAPENAHAADSANCPSTRANWQTDEQSQSTHPAVPKPLFVQQAHGCRDGGTSPPSLSNTPPERVSNAACRRTFSIACALRFDIAANRVGRDIPSSADEVTSRPQRRQASQNWELLAQNAARRALQPCNDLVGRPLRGS